MHRLRRTVSLNHATKTFFHTSSRFIRSRKLSIILLLLPVALILTLLTISHIPGRLFKPIRLRRLRLTKLLTAHLTPAPPTSEIFLQTWSASPPSRNCLAGLRLLARPSRGLRARCCLRRLRREMPLAFTRRDAPLLARHAFSPHFLARLPPETLRAFLRRAAPAPAPAPARPRTCAVVSNAPSLALRDFGRNLSAEIDAADAVFRINVAPVRGFEAFVGAKETVRVMNTHKGLFATGPALDNFAAAGSAVFVRDPFANRGRRWNMSRAWNVRQFGGPGVLDNYLAVRREHPDANIFINHSVFSEFALLFLPALLVGEEGKALSSGSLAVILALMTCEKVVSYEVASQDELSLKYRYYYDRGSRGYKWWHPFNTEVTLLDLLSSHRRPGTSIFEYDMSGSECAD